MIVSNSFNSLYHSIINDFHKKLLYAKLYFKDEKQLKEDLKKLNDDYPADEYIPKSTTQISSKQLMQHLEFITMLAGENKITLEYAEREWERLMRECH